MAEIATETVAETAVATDRSPLAERGIRVVLVQIRGLPQAKRHEVWCIRQCTGLDADQIYSWNVVDRPEVRWSTLRRADAIIIGGSGDHSVTEDYPFMPWLEDLVQSAVAHRMPLFGICWGHHMMARALGGEVVTDPDGEEIGTYEVDLTPAGSEDPLFEGLPGRFLANLVHHDRVIAPPEGFHELATSERCGWQTMRLDGLPVYGTQFHGEMTPAQLRRRLLMYKDHYLETEEQAEEVVESLRKTEEAHGLLRRFLELYT
ncbi:MAG: type 1 glutamine amidotransferase [bacterium]|nr:type 1 glutamine amidotransferase [bacterium]